MGFTIKTINKRRRIRRKTETIPKIRILKSDIRRSYSTMLTNVLNSNDFSLLFGFFDTFFTSNTVQSTSCYTNKGTLVISEIKEGISEIFKFWCNNLSMIPDAVMNLTSAIVEPNENKIRSSFIMKATGIYDHPFPGTPITNNNFEENKSGIVQQSVDDVTNSISKLSLRSNPLHLITTGFFILTLDNEKRITKMDFCIQFVD